MRPGGRRRNPSSKLGRSRKHVNTRELARGQPRPTAGGRLVQTGSTAQCAWTKESRTDSKGLKRSRKPSSKDRERNPLYIRGGLWDIDMDRGHFHGPRTASSR